MSRGRKLGHVGADFRQYAGGRVRFDSGYRLQQLELLLVGLKLSQNLCIEVAYLDSKKPMCARLWRSKKR